MAHIPERDIERLKREIALVALLQRQGFTLKKQGKDYVTHCPFHDDKTPSLVISPDKNLWHCLGACGTGGSVIDWVMRRERLGFHQAATRLLKQLPGLGHETPGVQAEVTPPPKSPPPKGPPPGAEVDPQAMLQRVVTHYHQRLLHSKAARAYLHQRGLDHEELISHFKLGFSERKLGQILAARGSAQGIGERHRLKALGVTLESGNERFAGSLVVPILSQAEGGESITVEGLYGRRIHDKGLRPGTPVHQYLPGPHRGVWNQAGIATQRQVLLCESLIDALTLWCHGFHHVTTSYGVNGFTEALHRVLKAGPCERVYIAYDGDEAGDAAARALIERLSQDRLVALRLPVPRTLDINAWALQEGGRFSEVFGECVLQACAALPHSPSGDPKAPGGDRERCGVSGEQAASGSGDNGVKATKTTNNTEGGGLEGGEPDGVEVTQNGPEIHLSLGPRHYRVRGLENNKHYEQLKINLMLRHEEQFFIDALDLYQAKQRQQFIRQASVECGVSEPVLKADLGRVLLRLESLQEAQQSKRDKPEVVTLSDQDTAQALALLKDKHLLTRILDDFAQCGVVGEQTNTLVGYLAGVSRKLDKPLAVVIQSSSAAGKSALMEAVLNMMPPEERVQYSAMTGQSLYYLGETDLTHKILAISEEEGVEHASYALKLLQSEGEVTIASTGKNATTGNLETQSYHVQGPVMLFLTTTAIDIDEELLNRCLVLTVNESQAQTEAIHAQQRFGDTLAGLLAKTERTQCLSLHHNAQRLLKPLKVVNPYAERLTFLSHKTRTRRDHQKYLTLIKSLALLHQYQREVKHLEHEGQTVSYIEVSEADIATANRLAHEVLGRTLDELPPQTRTLLHRIHAYVQQRLKATGQTQKAFRFSRREIREFSGWGNTQLKIHCQRLEELEYLLVHQGGRGKPLVYELLYDGQGEGGEAFLPGLLSLEPQKVQLDGQRSGQKGEVSGSSRPQVGGESGGGRPPVNGVQARCDKTLDLFSGKTLLEVPPDTTTALVPEATTATTT